jgi:hypothetical protein
MDLSNFEKIKRKIQDARLEKARAEGAMNKIKEQLKKEFDLEIDEVPAKIEELEASISADKNKLSKYLTQLEEVTDWDAI